MYGKHDTIFRDKNEIKDHILEIVSLRDKEFRGRNTNL